MVGMDGYRLDHAKREELNYSAIEFPVSFEESPRHAVYNPNFVFLIDLSHRGQWGDSVQKIIRNQILSGLKLLEKKSPLIRVGFITYHESIHLAMLRATQKRPRIITISDTSKSALEDLYFDLDNILVNLKESWNHIEKFITQILPRLVQPPTDQPSSALGPALQICSKLLQCGGKMIIFQNSLPSIGDGALLDRKSPRKESEFPERSLLSPHEFYKAISLELIKNHLSCDVFLIHTEENHDAMASSFSPLVQNTGGELCEFTIPFEADFQTYPTVALLEKHILHNLSREIGFGAVMRIRASKGLVLEAHYGHFFLRTMDLLSLPCIDSEKGFSVKFRISNPKELASVKNLCSDGKHYGAIQAGLQYTNLLGERRIRIITKYIEFSNSISDIEQHIDPESITNFIGKLAVSKAFSDGFPKAIQLIQNSCSRIIHHHCASSKSVKVELPEKLSRLVEMCLALSKSVIFQKRGVEMDERVCAMLKYLSSSKHSLGLSKIFSFTWAISKRKFNYQQ
jgi:protein transport protein SEC24